MRHDMIRLMVVEGEESVRAALRDLLEAEESFEVVAVAGDVQEAIGQARATQPDVALLSVKLQGGGGARAASEIAAVSPSTRLLALSAYDDRMHVVEMLDGGVIGYLLKGGATSELVEAIERAARDQASFPAAFVAELRSSSDALDGRLSDALIEAAPDAVVLVQPDGEIVRVNAEAERLFGYTRDELVGAPLELLLPERLRDQHVGQRHGFAANPQPRGMESRLELAARRKDGSEFPVDISLTGFESAEGMLTAAFVRDDTERRARIERERELVARRAVLARVVSAGEDERRQIAADIHDDSIQVMTAAGMRLQILRRSLTEPAQLERLGELEQAIQLSIARLRHLIFELRPPALDLEGLAEALRAYVEDLSIETGLIYEIEELLTSEPPEATRVILYRIAQEVLTNVRKHAGAKRVTIALSDRAGAYHVRIADDGVGFTPDLAVRRPGHLGLAAVRERAELAGGSLLVDSRPGAGTIVEYWVTGTLDEMQGEE